MPATEVLSGRELSQKEGLQRAGEQKTCSNSSEAQSEHSNHKVLKLMGNL